MLTTTVTIQGLILRRSERTGAGARNGGFTLIELLIALLLGALVVGGVATIFISSQQTYLRLTEYNNAQEAFRYASHTITRLTRGATAIAPSGDNNLVLEFSLDEEDPFERLGTDVNCLGQPFTGDRQFNRFCISNGNLVCEVSVNNPILPGSACPGDPNQIFIRGIDTLTFEYATGDSGEYMAEYENAGGTDWARASGVRVTLGMAEGYLVSFTASVRSQLVPEDVRVCPAGGCPPAAE